MAVSEFDTKPGPVGRPRRNGNVRGNTRDEILDAAEEIVATLGGQALTLDAVYRKAGVSKGGLLYHFPTKEALIDGMVERYMARSFAAEDTLRAELAPGGDMASRGTIANIALDDPGADRVSAALLAAVANDLDRLAPVRAQVRRRFEEMQDSPVGFEAAAIVELAVTGLTILELLRLRPLSGPERHRVLSALDRMAGGTGDLPTGPGAPDASTGGER